MLLSHAKRNLAAPDPLARDRGCAHQRGARAHQGPSRTQRDGFVTSIGALTATLGSAVGLGNIWKFPFLAGKNGGTVFVFAYLICVALVGLPVLVAEPTIVQFLFMPPR